MTLTENQSPAEMFRSAIEDAGWTIVDDVPDDLTRDQLLEILEKLLGQMRPNVSTSPAHQA